MLRNNLILWIKTLYLLLFFLLFPVYHVHGKVSGVLIPYIPEEL